MRNFFTRYTGGASTRAGTQAVARVRTTNLLNPPHLVDFVYRTAQAYILEFGHQYMRVHMNPAGGQPGLVLEPALAIAGVTQASPGVFNVVSHGFSVGDQLVVSGAQGMTAINSTTGFQVLVGTVPDANHFTATDLDGNQVSTAALPAYTGGGVAARVFTLVTPYAAADVANVKYTQNADVMTLTHPDYAPRNLTRTQHWAWTLAIINFQATVQVPVSPSATPVNPGAAATVNDYWYVVTSLTDTPNEESVPTAPFKATNAPLNQTTGVNNLILWSNPASGPGPARYNIYRAQPVGTAAGSAPTVFGYIGQSTTGAFTDANFLPDFTQTPPTHENPFDGGNNPGAVGYYQGRQIFGGSDANPNTIWASKSANYSNMDFSSPGRDDDAITDALTSQRVNAIKHLVSLNSLLALSSDGAWQISAGAAADVLTPTTTVAKPQAYNGCNDVRPLIINYDVLYVSARGSHVRDLAYQFYLNIFTGDDKSVLSQHLFEGRQIVRWAYADEPLKAVWAVRDDGIALCFTYLKEQDVYAWSRHDTMGRFESVASIPEGNEDAVYFVVTRTIPGVNAGQPVQMVERLHSRSLGANAALGIQASPEAAWCVDCALQYGPTVIAGATLFPGPGATTGGSSGVPFSANAAVFSAGMVGRVIRANGGIATITSFVNTAQVIGTVWPWAPFAAYPNDPSASAVPAVPGSWSCTAPTSTVSGLDHLNGRTVAILADGSVQPSQIVANGSVSLPAGVAASIITVGLPFQAQLMTLPLDLGEPTSQGKRKKIAGIHLNVQETRGLKVGPVKLNADTANLPQLTEIKERTNQAYGQPLPLATGFQYLIPDTLYSKEGVVLVQQDLPLPATVLGIVPTLIVGDDPG